MPVESNLDFRDGPVKISTKYNKERSKRLVLKASVVRSWVAELFGEAVQTTVSMCDTRTIERGVLWQK